MMLATIDVNWASLAPMLSLFIFAALGVIVSLFQEDGRFTALLSFIGVSFSALFNLNLFATGRSSEAYVSSFGLRYLADQPALAFNFVILIGLTLTLLISYDYLERTGLDQPEYSHCSC